ncbi:MAG: dihydrofolate reductase family protein [Cumulibacter sp.]
MTRQQAAASDGFLVGRVTFEEMRGFWPERRHDEPGVTNHLNQVEKYVVSRGLADPGWDGTTIPRGGDSLASEIRALQAREGADIVLTGSISLAQQLLELDLVDELRLFVYPVVLGAGHRLFIEQHQRRNLTLAENRSFKDGVALLRYTRAGVGHLS